MRRLAIAIAVVACASGAAAHAGASGSFRAVALPASPVGDFAIGALWGAGHDLYALGSRTLWHTTDGGRTWTVSAPAGIPRDRVLGLLWGLDARRLFLIDGPASDGPADYRLWASADAGKTWQARSRIDPVFSIRDNGRGGLLAQAGGQGACRILGSDDGGVTWSERWRGRMCGLGLNVLSDGRGGLLVAGDHVGPTPGQMAPMLLRSTDGGKRWSVTTPAVHTLFPSFGDVAKVEGALVAECSGRCLCRSTDGGASWTRVGDLPPTPPKDNPLVLFLAASGRYVLAWREPSGLAVASTDSGATWHAAPGPLPAGATFLAAWVSPAGDVWLGGSLRGQPLLVHGHL